MKTMVNRVVVAALATVLLCATGQSLFADIVSAVTDDFGNPNYPPTAFTQYNQPGHPSLQSKSTGFRWTGYGVSNFYAFLDTPTTTQIDSRLNGNTTGSYTYTIFDSTGGNSPSFDVFHLDSVTVNWAQVGGGSYTGTGTARIMIRDASGNWFLSDQTIPMLGYTSQTLDATTATWQSLAGTVSTLNDVTDDDTGLLTIGPSATPDLTFVTGGGYYAASDTYNGAVVARAESITFSGPALPEPATITLAVSGLLTLVFFALRRRARSRVNR